MYSKSRSQSHCNPHLQINVTHVVEVFTTSRTPDDVIPSYTVSSSGPTGQLPPPPPGLYPDRYTLLRLSNIGHRDALKILKTNVFPHIEELDDGSWEIAVLKPYSQSFRDTLRKMFPESSIDLDYDPLEPTANDVELWGYCAAKELSEHMFLQRSEMVDWKGSPAATPHFGYLQAILRGLKAGQGRDNDSDTQTILDEMTLKPKEVVGVSRSYGNWMFKIQFYESILSPEYYERLHIYGDPASSFAASCVITAKEKYRVEWKTQWQPSVPNELWPDLNKALGSKLAIIALPTDTLLWRADSSKCIINGDGPAYHLCMKPNCFECQQSIRIASTEPHFRDDKWKKAAEFLATILQALQEQHPDDVVVTVKAILDLAYYENPFSDLFLAEDDSSSQNSHFSASCPNH